MQTCKLKSKMRIFLIVLGLMAMNNGIKASTANEKIGEDWDASRLIDSSTDNHDSSAHNISNDQGLRFKRDGSDAFTEYHSKITLASRIFSGISLRIGLHDGSITGDQLISELLNLSPSIQLDDVEKFDKTKLDQFFKDVAGFANPVASTVEAMNKIWMLDVLKQKYAGIEKPDDRTGLDEYIGKVKKFKEANVDYNFLGKVFDKIDNTMASLKKIATKATGNLDQSDLSSIKIVLVMVETLPDNINNLLSTLKSHEDLFKSKILDADLVKLAKLIEEFYRQKNKLVKRSGSSFSSSLSNTLSNVKALSPKFNEIKQHLDVARSIIVRQMDRKAALGFVDGFSDIIQLRKDVKDTWLPTVIEKYDGELVKSELDALEQFEKSAKNVEGAWKDINGWTTIGTLTTVLNTFESAGGALDNTILRSALEKARFEQSDGYATAFLELVNKVLNFRKSLIHLRPRLEALLQMEEVKQLKNLTAFHKVIDFSHNEKVKDVLLKLPSTEHLSKTVKVMKTLQTELEGITNLTQSDPNQLAGEIEQEEPAIKTFLEHNDKKEHLKYFDEVKALQLNKLLEPVKLLKALVRIKNTAAKFQPALEAITTKISGSMADFKALRAVPAAIKSTKSARIDELVKLKSIDGASKTFGEAAMVLDTAQKILSQKAAIEKLVKDGWKVDKEIELSTKKEQLAKEWGDFGEVAAYFDTLLTELESKTSSLSIPGRVRRQTVTLKDVVDKLTALQGLADLDVDLQPKVGVLEQLTGLTDGAQLQSTMESLATLDLKFSSHQSALGSAGQQVGTASQLFAAIAKNSTSSTNPGGNGGGGDGPNSNNPLSSGLSASGDDSADGETEEEETNYVIVVVVVVVILGCIAGVGYAVYLHLQKEQPVEEGTTPDDHSNDGSKAGGDGSKTDGDKKDGVNKDGGNKDGGNKDGEKNDVVVPLDEVEATPKLNDLAGLSTRTARAKSVVEEHFDISTVSDKKRAIAYEYKDCLQVMMEDRRLRKEQMKVGKKEMEKQKEETKVAEKKMPELKNKLGDKLADDVEKFAKAEYEENVARIAHAKALLSADKVYDVAVVMTEKECNFEYLVMTPLAMCRDSPKWVLIDDVWVPPQRLGVYCEKMRDMMIYFDPREECIMNNLNVTWYLNPYHLRLQDANAAVDRLNQSCEFMKHLNGVTNVQVFDKYVVRLTTGLFVNATWFSNKYGKGKLIISAPPGALNKSASILHMLWQENVKFTATVICTKYFDAARLDPDSPYRCHLRDETLVVTSKRFDVMEQKIVLKCGKEERVITNYDVSCQKMMCEMNLVKTADFRNVFRHIVRKTTRQGDKNTVFFDTDGSYWAAILAGADLISSSLSHDGIVDATVTTQLTKMLCRRGRMFTTPYQVMLMILLAVDMFMEDHKQTGLSQPQWKELEQCDEEKPDMEQKKKKFGEEKAKKMRLRGDDSVENLPDFEDKNPALTAQLKHEKEMAELMGKYNRELEENEAEHKAQLAARIIAKRAALKKAIPELDSNFDSWDDGTKTKTQTNKKR